jgi:hypothetical protein
MLKSLGLVWVPGVMAGMLVSGASPIYAGILSIHHCRDDLVRIGDCGPGCNLVHASPNVLQSRPTSAPARYSTRKILSSVGLCNVTTGKRRALDRFSMRHVVQPEQQ